MIASLPMYDRPETQAANDRFWQAIRTHLPDAPKVLTRSADPNLDWRRPDLLVSQTCSLPFRTTLLKRVRIVASPAHDLLCKSGHYFSVIVIRTDDPRNDFAAFANAPIAVNDPMSQSGWQALWAMADARNITLGPAQVTGSHRASAEAVATGTAELAALDAVTWRMIQRWDALASQLRVLMTTPETPALPFVTARSNDPAPLRAALEKGVRALSPDDRATLCLNGITDVPEADYTAQKIPPRPCISSENP